MISGARSGRGVAIALCLSTQEHCFLGMWLFWILLQTTDEKLDCLNVLQSYGTCSCIVQGPGHDDACTVHYVSLTA